MFRNPLRRYRVAIAPAIVLLSIASVIGLAHASRSSQTRPFESATSAAPAAPHTTLLVGRTKLANALVFSTRAVRERHIPVDALLFFAVVLLAAALYFGRSTSTRHNQLRIDALFVRRRGPPHLLFTS